MSVCTTPDAPATELHLEGELPRGHAEIPPEPTVERSEDSGGAPPLEPPTRERGRRDERPRHPNRVLRILIWLGMIMIAWTVGVALGRLLGDLLEREERRSW
jgi:hypothetical protein